ncbi:hypothetical protein Mal4_44820 [Maioricimonas rarisocia]|uniref:GGDEF domain-containing protein n=1 Tax=Maioricimonas rarisocia TaxID=2528026 RepID=A0A517ZCE7_9PLAN|nr:diguanylate cyclase [Maioricimonas rarisocia]QDU40127.1 hypothetical protein Mal4_44820 [Maioricimonas rarisocia]
MQHYRLWVAGMVNWLFLLFNIERIHEPLDLASFVYVLVTIGSVCLLVFRRLRDIPLAWTLLGTLLVYVLFKAALGYHVSPQAWPIMTVEAIAICITLFLATMIGRTADAFTESAAELVQIIRGREVPQLSDVEAEMQREIRRARRHERPLAMVTIQPQDASMTESLGRFVRELEDELARRYAMSGLAELLLNETKSNDIVAWDGKQFLLLLPETQSDQAAQMLERIRQRIATSLGLQVDTGLSAFPGEEITFNGLLERASDSTSSEPVRDSDAPSDLPLTAGART